MRQLVAPPMSRRDIRALTHLIRKLTGLEKQFEFPVVPFIEYIMPEVFDENFHLVIGAEKDMGDIHGLSDRNGNFIKIREDVYDGACKGVGRDRFTCAHEIGHYFLHPRPVYARTVNPIKAFQDPEWQANAFAGELLIPYSLTKEMSPFEIEKRCVVSPSAAHTQYNAIHKRG